MSEIHYGKCEKCHYMGGLNNSLVCLECVDEKKLLSKSSKKYIASLEKEIQQLKEELKRERELTDKLISWEDKYIDHFYKQKCIRFARQIQSERKIELEQFKESE